MINWLAVKKAADVAALDEGFIDNNRKMNPVPVDPMKQIRNQAFQQKMVEVPKAYVKGVAQDMANPQAWQDAVHSVGTQWNRGFRMMKPMAHLLYKEPISMFGKGAATLGEKTGLMTPQQAQQQRATWDWWTRPQREQMEEIRQRFPYAERLQNNPFYTVPASLLEEGIATAGLGTAAKGAGRIVKATNNKIKAFRGKPTNAYTANGSAIDMNNREFVREMRRRPEYKKLIDKADRSIDLEREIWNNQQMDLSPEPIVPYLRKQKLPEVPDRIKFNWTDAPVDVGYNPRGEAIRYWDNATKKPFYVVENNLYNDFPFGTRQRMWFDPKQGVTYNVPKLRLTDSLKHELGHIKDHMNRVGRAEWFPRVKQGPLADLKTIINPWKNSEVMDEVAADTYAFASPKTGKLSKFATFRHHPGIQTYLTWEQIMARERMAERARAAAEAATAAAGAYPFLNVKDDK